MNQMKQSNFMTPDVAKQNLLDVLTQGRILYKGLPLSGVEIQGLHNSVLCLYSAAMEKTEDKLEANNKKKPPSKEK